ncbi:helix-turn-helix domain-containing protein [Chryseolinea sp. T2]|uniref:AraC family transcriptional regulator n=1 Tax=Chryseolinea sp. T2 TaxID=3129255 RepID=UPI0030782EE6
MDYHTIRPHPDLSSIVKCYWTLEVPYQNDAQRQLIVPDGCIEMIFILGDDVKRFTSGDEYIIQPRDMVLGQITEPFYVLPSGDVKSFAVRFYPYGFSNFVSISIGDLVNKETPLVSLFGNEVATALADKIRSAADTLERIELVDAFLLERLITKPTVDGIVKRTIDAIFSTKGKVSINTIVNDDSSKRRQLERKFLKEVGVSPKQLGKMIRLQSALKMLLNNHTGSLTEIAYESDYYNQAHFIKDFREFTGTTPKAFLGDEGMILSSVFYKQD